MMRALARPALAAVLALGLTVSPAVAGAAALAQDAAPALQASPRDDYRGLRDGLVLRFTGPAPAGRVVSAALVGLRQDLSEAGREPVDSGLNSTATQPTFVRNSGGTLEGEVVLGCLFAAPSSPGSRFCDFQAVQGQVRSVQAVVQLAGVDAPVTSTLVPVDVTRPTIKEPSRTDRTDRGYSVVATDTIRVLFSEPVRHEQGDSPTDWTVTLPDGRPVPVLAVQEPSGETCRPRSEDDVRIGRSRCVRLLNVRGLPEDAQPQVEHAAGAERISKTYEDFAENGLDRSSATGAGARGTAADLVRPAAPAVEAVDGAAPTGSPARASGGSAAPLVRLSGLTPGQSVRVQVTRPDGSRFSTRLVEVTASEMTVRVPDEPETLQAGDGEHVLLAEAVDDSGNSSLDPALRPARADSGRAEVRYRLDVLVPELVRAQRLAERDVLVAFSEPVSGTDDPLDWVVTDPNGTRVPVLEVKGSEATRTLRTASPVPGGSRVEYRPVATSRRYADGARNAVVDPAVAVVGAVAVPVLRQPAGRTVTRATEVLLAGEVEPGRAVEVYVDADDDGRPDSTTPVRTVPGTAGQSSFSVRVPLRENSDNSFLVLARDPDSGAVSGPADVPTTVQDAEDPRVALQAPRGGEVFAGGSQQEVRYGYEDRNPGAGPVQVLFAADGTSFTELNPGASATGPFRFRVPSVSTTSARVRLVPRDAAGRVGLPVTSAPFTIDAVPPVFQAVTRDARTVVVTFSKVVSGRSTALDWRVKGSVPATAEESRTADGRTVVTLRTGTDTAIGPDELPEVRYEPAAATTEYQDVAGQRVEVVRRVVVASDGILPAAPSVTSPSQPVLTRERSVDVSGRTDTGSTVLLLDAQGDEVGRSAGPSSDGAWTAAARLRADATNDLRAVAVDRNGNSSASAVPVARIEQDATDPVVSVSEPQGGARVEPGQRVTVRWGSTDRNLQDGATLVETSTDGGSTWMALAERQPAAGSTTWTVPGTVTPDARVRVSTTDRAGRTGRSTSGPIGIGTAALGTATPSATPSVSPSASPSATPTATASSTLAPELPPLDVEVSPGSITHGQLAKVTVTGRPGTTVELRAYSRPSTRYVRLRTGTLGPTGRTSWQVKLRTNTRLFARATDGSGQGDSRSAVITVRTALSLTVVRNGRRDYTFQGRILPRRAGQLITLYRVEPDGRRVSISQLRTDSTGTYRLRRVFTGSGRFGFLARTGATLTNAAGESNDGRPRPTFVH